MSDSPFNGGGFGCVPLRGAVVSLPAVPSNRGCRGRSRRAGRGRTFLARDSL